MTRLLAILVTLSALCSAVFLGMLVRQGQREIEAARRDRQAAQQARDDAERWAKQQVWATGFYLRDKLNAEHALEVEREKCGAW